MRKEGFSNGEFYHVYNRGVDKRIIFIDNYDFGRFLQGIEEFNTIEPIGSIYENSFNNKSKKMPLKMPLVNLVAYCLNPNHYHLILKQRENKGIEKFMHKLGLGYAKFFNNKYKRSGSLFQGKFKAKHINTNEYLLHLSAYVNLNSKAHRLGNRVSKSSICDYKNKNNVLINSEVILDQFKNFKEYEEFANLSLKDILERKQLFKEMEGLLIES
ncbi:transposase [Candidatus Giovannonibacteria bacterium]|nr:transposase [Candidatus Giovannonibacteria bacterium]